MADKTGRLVKFVAKLNRMTQEGRIQWELYNPPSDLVSGSDDKIPFFFGAEVNNRKLALYVRRRLEYDPQRDEQYWYEKPVLAFCEDDWTPVWEFPRIAGVKELRDSIQRLYVKADSFIDEFLKEDDK
jgi:hypothetical protein